MSVGCVHVPDGGLPRTHRLLKVCARARVPMGRGDLHGGAWVREQSELTDSGNLNSPNSRLRDMQTARM